MMDLNFVSSSPGFAKSKQKEQAIPKDLLTGTQYPLPPALSVNLHMFRCRVNKFLLSLLYSNRDD